MGFMDLWTLFVENVFGGFWMSVFGMSIIFMITMAIGGVSAVSMFFILGLFFFAMAIGYGFTPLAVFFTIAVFGFMLFQINQWMERGGS